MRKLFLRSELEKHFLAWAHQYLFTFCLRNKNHINDEDMQEINRLAKILKELFEGYD